MPSANAWAGAFRFTFTGFDAAPAFEAACGGRIISSEANSISTEKAISWMWPETYLPATAPTYEPIMPGTPKSSTVVQATSPLRA